jgi:predicted component of type VI protein secretion system
VRLAGGAERPAQGRGLPPAGGQERHRHRRRHATIRYEGGEFQIADLDSSNGCFVNDEKIQKHDLIDNDIIKLGDIEFEFKCRAMREKRE